MRVLQNKRILSVVISLCCFSGWVSAMPECSFLHFPQVGEARNPIRPTSRSLAVFSPSVMQGFGIGPTMSTLYSPNVDQVFFPGFNVSSVWSGPEYIVELRGRFFFGEVDAYSIEAAGYRPMSTNHPALHMGGGIGYGGMNLKEVLVFDINGQPLPGVFFHNGRGLHTFLGIGAWVSRQEFYQVRADLDYFLALYHVDKMRIPSGVRFSISVYLHAPEK
ncbi:MAG: hypothetical protein R6V49_02600 [Bacteroidales bacterium]